MTQYELMRSAESLLILMQANNIDASDVKYLDMFREFSRQKAEGNKVGYIVYYLSQQYDCSEATIYRVVKRMEKSII